LHRDGHQQRQGADVVHEGREHRPQTRQGGDTCSQSGPLWQETLSHHVDGAGPLQAVAEYQHAGHGDHGPMAEAVEGPLLGKHARQHAGEQRGQGHHVVAPAAPEEQPDAGRQDGEDDCLFVSHAR
jgi:hypothetical protein